MPIYDLISESTGRSYRVNAPRELTDDEVAFETERYDRQAQLAEQSKPFLDVTDLASSVGSAFGGLRKTLPASIQRLRVGLNRPDTYPEGAKRAFSEEKEFSDQTARENTYRLLTGNLGSVGESIREAGPSLGFSLASMGAAIPSSVAGGVAGTAIGGPVGGVIGGTTAGMSASGLAAYRMAGSQFLNEAFNTYLQNNPGADEATKEAAYQELLPLAQNSALWEAGPEAIGNAATMGAGKILLGIGRKGLERIARSALAKTGALVGAQATELATETATQLGQGLPQAKAEAFNRGEDMMTAKSPYTSDEAGAIQAFKDVAPQTLALGGLMLGAGGAIKGGQRLFQKSPTIEGDALVPTEQAPPPVEEPEDDYGVAAFQQQMTEIAAQPDPIAPIQQTVTAAAENSVRVNANVLPATAAVIEAGGLAPAPTVEQPAPVVDQPRTREEEIAQNFARLRLNLSAEEREDMEQQLAQAQAEGAAADQTAEERRQAIQREDIIRRQQDREAELQRLAEERQRATAREQQRQQPPVVEETVTPIQPVPAVEETGAPEITPEQVPNVENVIDEPGAAEVGLGMEKKAKSFKNELEMSGVAYLNGDRWGIKQSSDGTFYVEQTVNGERKIVASNFPDIETAQVGAISAAFYPAVEPTRATVTPDQTMEEGRIPRDETPPQGSPPTDKALVKPVIRRTGSKVAGASVAGQQIASANASRIATLKMLNDAVGAYPNEDFSGIDPSQINEVMDYMISLQLPQPIAPAPTVQRDVTKPEIPAELKAKGIVNIVGSSKDAKTFDKWLADQGVSDSQINPENGDGGAGYLYLDRGTEKAGQFSWSSKSRTGVDSRLVFKLPDGRNVVWLIETQSIYEVDPTKIDPNPYFKEETAFEKPPEQMSPDEVWADEQATMGAYASKEDTRMVHEMDVNTALGKNKRVSAAAVDAYKITLPEGYVRQGDLYVFQPSGTVEAVTDEAETYTQFRNRIERENAEEFQGLTASEKSDILDDFADLGKWGEALVKRAETEQLSDDVLDDYVDRFGLDTYAIRFRGKAEQRQYVPKVVRQQPGKESLDVRTRGQKAADTRKAREKAPAKPKNMAGEVRPERAKPTPAPEFTTIHPKTQEKFNTAFEAKDAGAMNSLLDPMNKGSRAEFERRTGVKLPTTQKGTRDSVETWAATTPVADLTDTELDRDLLRLGEYSKKTYASDVLKARALELAKEFQKRQDVAATDKAAGEASSRKKAIAKKALAATGGRGTVGNLAGDSLAQVRADLLSEITDTKVPKSKAGINALMKAFYQEFGIAADTEAGMQKKLAQALQDAVTETAPQPKPAETELAQVGDEVTWMAAGGEARGTVYAVRGDSADIDYFGPKTVPLSELSIVRKSGRRLAQEKRDAEAAASTAQKKPQEPEQPKPKSKFTKAEVASLEQGKTPEGWTLSVGEPVTVTDTKGKTWEVKMQFSPTRTMTLVSGDEAQTFDVQTAPQPKPAAEVETPVAGVPAEFPDPATLTNAQINKEKAALTKKRDSITDRMIAANRGSEVSSETMKKTDPLSKEFQEVTRRFQDLSNEAEMRMGSRVYGDLPTDKSWKSYRRKKPEDFGSTNTVVTKEAKDQAAKNLRKSLGQTNVGLNPETLKYAITVGTYYLEGGVRSFADFSAKMVEEFGEGVRKYLKPAYEALRKRTDIDTTGMDPVEGVETAPVVEAPTAPAAAPAAKVEAEAPKAAPTQATPRPVPAPSQEPDVVAIANDPVDIQREALGLPPIMRKTQEAYTFPQMWSDAEAAMQANPERGKALVKTLNDNPRNISALEDAILLRERVNRVNALDLAMVEFNKAPKGNNEDQRKALDDAITSLTDLDNALAVAGTEQGRSLNARKMLARQDYTLAKMISTLRAANDGDLSEADLATVTRLQKQIDETQKKLAEVESGQADRIAEAEKIAFEAGRKEVLKDIEERAKNEAERVAEMQKRKAEYLAAKKEAARTPSKWEEIRAAARARNAELRSNLYSDVVLVKAASMAVNDVIIGATYIAEGVTKLADWVSKMRSEDINLTDDEMQQLFKESKAFDAGEDLPASEAPLKVKKAKAPAIDKVKAIAADEEALDSRTVYNLVVEKMKKRAEESKAAKLPEMSADDLTSVISEVTADVKEFFPDITEREIRDLFSGYGKILMPSKEELAKQIRQLSALGKLQSAIEDAEAKRAPLKSGPQRDKATQAIRLQQKKLARELRMMGRDYEAGEEQLRSPLDAIKARLNNQIDDLAMEINTRKKAPRRPSVDYDKDTQELADLRDELKRISDFINAPAGPTFTELVNEEMKKLDARIAELQKTLAEGKFSPKEDTALYTQELQVKRDERDRLSKLVAEARKKSVGDTRTQGEIDRVAVSEAKKAIAELERKIADKDLKRPENRTPTETADYKALIDEKKRLQGVLSKMRQEAEGRQGMTDEQRVKQAAAAIDKSIERMQKMLTSGNYDVPKRTSKTPETPELAQKRETRDKLRKQLLELRKLKRDALIDPIAKQLKTDKKRIQTRMDKLKKRMETGDFSKPEKRKKATDDELLALQVEEENLKEAWAKIVFERQLASRGPGKRLLDAGQQTINTARAVLTSFDVSAVLRQGGFIVLGNPLRGFRNLGPMFQAFGSDKFAKEEKFRLERRENFKNGAYQQSKLFLADVNKVDQMTQQEEAFMSRWVNKLPKGAKGLYIGSAIQGSQRAYTVFLNRLRMDTFDAMVANLKKGSEPTPQEMSAVANYINIATGRGDLGKFSQAGTMLNTVFFAPRLVASRFQILAGYPYFTASGRTKALVLREYGKFFAGATLVYVIGALAQGDDDEPIETDPRSSDFLKIRFGDTRVDPLSGLIQATVLVSRLVSGEKKQASGKIVPIRGEKVPYGADDSFDVISSFVRTKFSPIVGSAVNVATGKNVVGEPTDIGEETKRMLIPMSFNEMKETLEAQGVPEATALIMLQLFGMGVQTYTPGKK